MSSKTDDTAEGVALQIIRHFEGCYLTSYIFPGEEHLQATIGWGHRLDLSQHPKTIDQATADELLAKDVGSKIAQVKAKVPAAVFVELTAYQSGAIFSWAFNSKGWDTSDTVKTLIKGDLHGFIVAESQWYHGENHKVLAGLVRRRASERHIFERNSVSEVEALHWYTDLIAAVNKSPKGSLQWQKNRLIWQRAARPANPNRKSGK
jgi:GH24 family phage-related lysozyme (muramidase)